MAAPPARRRDRVEVLVLLKKAYRCFFLLLIDGPLVGSGHVLARPRIRPRSVSLAAAR